MSKLLFQWVVVMTAYELNAHLEPLGDGTDGREQTITDVHTDSTVRIVLAPTGEAALTRGFQEARTLFPLAQGWNAAVYDLEGLRQEALELLPD